MTITLIKRIKGKIVCVKKTIRTKEDLKIITRPEKTPLNCENEIVITS